MTFSWTQVKLHLPAVLIIYHFKSLEHYFVLIHLQIMCNMAALIILMAEEAEKRHMNIMKPSIFRDRLLPLDEGRN